ncbi:protein yippee-like At4g27740 [Apium graveolens]|uniref:protein yippee-like At4g27740 n=1 Tax=Apium graveolens TaxID=4045 RepID=UPI003D7B0307
MEPYSHPLYSCRKCRTPVALAEDLLSKSFVAKSGKAFMFSQAMNVMLGKSYDKPLITGNFTIADVYCNTCGEELGWKYIKVHEKTQMYKVGRIIIEKAKIVKEY